MGCPHLVLAFAALPVVLIVRLEPIAVGRLDLLAAPIAISPCLLSFSSAPDKHIASSTLSAAGRHLALLDLPLVLVLEDLLRALQPHRRHVAVDHLVPAAVVIELLRHAQSEVIRAIWCSWSALHHNPR